MGSYDEKKGNLGERFVVILTPSLTFFYSFLVLFGKKQELLNVVCPEDIHTGYTVDQREVQPEQDQRIISEGFMGERKGNGPSTAPLIM